MDQDSKPGFTLKDYLNWPLIGIVLAWGVLITQVRHHWGGESYYNFGMFVPFLAIWLWLRNMAGLEVNTVIIRGKRVFLFSVAAFFILVILPFQAVAEVNPFWRLPLWIQATGILAYSLICIYFLYGRRGVYRSIFPLLFTCMMIPWPWRIEQSIIQTLTGLVANIAVDGFHFIGYPVELRGNSVALGEISIGVNEACSGIRSLQALTMVTLFLGSLFGQSLWRRAAAVMILPLIVIFINSLRALFLGIQVITSGDAAYERWHDPAGYIAFCASMILIYACIELLNLGSNKANAPLGISMDQAKAILIPHGLGKSAILFPVLPILLFASVEGWFRYKEALQPERLDWTVNLPDESDPNIHYRDFDKRVESMLGFDFGKSFVFKSGRYVGEFHYYEYEKENKLSSVSSYGHKPTVCMTSTGSKLVQQFPNLEINIGTTTLPLHHYLFELPVGGEFVHVFWVVWEKRNMDINPDELEDLDYGTQWVQLLKGRRDFSRKVILLGLNTNEGETVAKTVTGKLLRQWIVPE